MAPELGRVIRDIEKYIVGQKGATEENLERLKKEAGESLAQDDYEKAVSISQELSSLNQLSEDVKEVFADLTELLERHDLQRVEIPYFSEEPGQEPVSEEYAQVFGEESIYVPHDRVIGLMKVVEVDNRGRFVNKNLDQVARHMLVADESDNPNSIDAAKRNLVAAKSRLAKGILSGASKNKRVKTVQTLISRHQESTEVDEHQGQLYQYIIQHHGKLSPKDFVGKVLNRFRGEAKEKEKKKEKKRRPIIVPSDLVKKGVVDPIFEVTLSGKLDKVLVLDKIEKEILGGQKLEEVINKNGWQSKYALPEAIKKARRAAASLKKPNTISDKEHDKAVIQITSVIHVLSGKQGRRGWHIVPQKTSLRFLFALMGEVKGDTAKIQKLTDILFPKRKTVVDKDSVIQLPGKND